MAGHREPTVFVLASGRGARRLDPAQSQPAALAAAPSDQRPALRWILDACRRAGLRRVELVGGYHIEKLIAEAPGLPVHHHARWSDESDAGALAHLLRPPQQLIAISGSLLVHREALDALTHRDAAAATANGRHVGLIKLTGTWTETAATLAAECPGLRLHALAERLAERGLPTVEIGGHANECDAGAPVAPFILSSKAITLERLAGVVRRAAVPTSIHFTVSEWRSRREATLDRIDRAIPDRRFAVRSSSAREDGWSESGAGRFETVLAATRPQLADAIDRVAASYAIGGHRAPGDDDRVLVQPYIEHARANGVLFTRDPATGLPCDILSADHAPGETDGVTSGRVTPGTTIRWRCPESPPPDGWRARVFALGDELRLLLEHDALDVEWVIDDAGVLHLLQVRPLVIASRPELHDDRDVIAELRGAAEHARVWLAGEPQGPRGVLAVMPDWNPAEIIGLAPRPFAFSVYRRLITSGAWAAGRARLGYSDRSGEPLMVQLAGRPYIDARRSAASFLPAGTPEHTARAVVGAAMSALRARPQLQDKLEFALLPTAAPIDRRPWRARLADAGLDAADADAFLDSLARLTDHALNAIDERRDRIEADLAALDRVRRDVAASTERDPSVPTLALGLRTLVHRTVELGAAPFAEAARLGFIALWLVRELEEAGAIDRDTAAALAAVPTVASEFAEGLAAAAQNAEQRAAFLDRFGHLRPGTYDPLVPTYAQRPDLYLDAAAPPDDPARLASPSPAGLYSGHGGGGVVVPGSAAARALRDAGLTATPDRLTRYVRTAIPLRESAKLEFTRALSLALDLAAALGRGLGLRDDDHAFLPVESLVEFAERSVSASDASDLRRAASARRKRWTLTRRLRLPEVLADPRDLFLFSPQTASPNFVHAPAARARAVRVAPGDRRHDLRGAIVLVDSADPGYDWIFSHRIAGLITRFGGVASHLAIRAAEFGIPAAIGCGESLFERLAAADIVELDPHAGIARPAGAASIDAAPVDLHDSRECAA